MRVHLASRSPRRRELLAAAGYEVVVGPLPDIDETLEPGCAVDDAVLHLARRKLVVASARVEAPCWLLAADTLVALDGLPLGKPEDADGARAMLHRLSGRAHEVWTGVALCWAPHGTIVARATCTQVRFSALSAERIDAYVRSGEPMDKAGGYAIQGGAAGFVEALEGPRDNVIGLPLDTVRALLRQAREARQSSAS